MRWCWLALSLIFSGSAVADESALSRQSLALAAMILSEQDTQTGELAYTRLLPFLLSEELRNTLLENRKITLPGDDPLLRWRLEWCPDERNCHLLLTFRDKVIAAPLAEQVPDAAQLWQRWGQKLAYRKGWQAFQTALDSFAEIKNNDINHIVTYIPVNTIAKSFPHSVRGMAREGVETHSAHPTYTHPNLPPDTGKGQLGSNEFFGFNEDLLVVIADGYLDPANGSAAANDAAWSDDVFNAKISSALLQGVFGLTAEAGNENRLSGQITASDGTSRKLRVYIEHSGVAAPWNPEKQRQQSARAYDLFSWGMATADIVIYNGHSRYGRYLDFGRRDDSQNPYKFHVGSLLFNLPLSFYDDIAKMKFRRERPQALIHLGCDSQALYQSRLEAITARANSHTVVFTLPGDIQQNDGPMMELLFIYGLLNGVNDHDLKRVVREAQCNY